MHLCTQTFIICYQSLTSCLSHNKADTGLDFQFIFVIISDQLPFIVINSLPLDAGFTWNKQPHRLSRRTQIIFGQPICRCQHFRIKPGARIQCRQNFFTFVFCRSSRGQRCHKPLHCLIPKRHHNTPAHINVVQLRRYGIGKLFEQVFYRQVDCHIYIFHVMLHYCKL